MSEEYQTEECQFGCGDTHVLGHHMHEVSGIVVGLLLDNIDEDQGSNPTLIFTRPLELLDRVNGIIPGHFQLDHDVLEGPSSIFC